MVPQTPRRLVSWIGFRWIRNQVKTPTPGDMHRISTKLQQRNSPVRAFIQHGANTNYVCGIGYNVRIQNLTSIVPIEWEGRSPRNLSLDERNTLHSVLREFNLYDSNHNQIELHHVVV